MDERTARQIVSEKYIIPLNKEQYEAKRAEMQARVYPRLDTKEKRDQAQHQWVADIQAQSARRRTDEAEVWRLMAS